MRSRNNKVIIDNCKSLAKLKRGQCLSDNYTDSRTKLKWTCEVGHVFFARFNHIKQGSWCPKCATKRTADLQRLSKDYYYDIAKLRDGYCLLDIIDDNCFNITTVTPIKWQCNCGHIWCASYNNIKRGSWCPVCSRKKLANKYRLSKLDYDKIACNNNGKCLVRDKHIDGINSKTKIKWKCSSGHVFLMNYNHVSGGNWCPKCANKYKKSQRRLQLILEKILKYKSETIRPDWLKNPNTGCNLEIDIYFPKLKLAVEYNGEQHYIPISVFGGREGLIKTQERDRIKRQLVKKAKRYINCYIEIPYTEKITEENISRLLEENKIYCKIPRRQI